MVWTDTKQGEPNVHVGRMNKDSSVNVFYSYYIDPYNVDESIERVHYKNKRDKKEEGIAKGSPGCP